LVIIFGNAQYFALQLINSADIHFHILIVDDDETDVFFKKIT